MIQQLRLEVRKLMDRVDEFSLRERALVFLGILALMYIGTIQLVIQPLTNQRTRLEQELKGKRDQIQSAERQIQVMLGGEVFEADATKRARLESVKSQNAALDAELSKTTSGLVTPKEMARLVESFLANKRGLKVLKVESLKPEPLLPDQSQTSASAAGGSLIYKHGMRIELSGSYVEMFNYLKGLEQLPWRVFWGQVSLQSEQYPVSRLTLVIYTLSTREAWIGT